MMVIVAISEVVVGSGLVVAHFRKILDTKLIHTEKSPGTIKLEYVQQTPLGLQKVLVVDRWTLSEVIKVIKIHNGTPK